MWGWTDGGGHPEGALTRDQVLDNISLYWFTATGTSSARLYWEHLGREGRVSWVTAGGIDLDRVDVPAGVSIFPPRIFPAPPRILAGRYFAPPWAKPLPPRRHI